MGQPVPASGHHVQSVGVGSGPSSIAAVDPSACTCIADAEARPCVVGSEEPAAPPPVGTSKMATGPIPAACLMMSLTDSAVTALTDVLSAAPPAAAEISSRPITPEFRSL